uniref:phosphate ABC transporter ATP-binding protein PstB n=1 Tax=Mycoplasmoides alvi TaxID=78580 RepID=UPI0038CBF56D
MINLEKQLNIVSDEEKVNIQQKIDETKNNILNIKSYIKTIPNVLELRSQIKSIKKDISQLKILAKDKKLNLEVFLKDFKNTNVFEVKNFCLWYKNGEKNALSDINIEIQKNKVTALIGPSGCGKSTFLRSLNRMNDLIDGVKITGDIWFLGKNISSKILTDLELRTRVGMVFQKPTPFNLSIYENIAYALKSHGIKDKEAIKEIVINSLKDAALWDEVKNILHESALGLSGGQQQRLCIARAIALQPDVLLMDEPTSALDPIATSKIEQLIFKLKEKFTIIIVTHSMAQAQRVSDQTIFFYQGKIIEFGQTKQIFTKPQQARTKDYISGRIG